MILPLLLLVAAPADCANAVTQSEMTGCARAEAEAASRALDAQWATTLAAMREKDVAEGLTGNADGYAQTLIASQQSWAQYREMQCRLESFEMRGGTAAPMIEYGCKARLTRERTAALRDLAEMAQ